MLDGGPASGTGSVATSATLAGRITEILPPGTGRDYYCVRIQSGTLEATQVSIRDVGDGGATHDEFATASGLIADCSVPVILPTDPFRTSTSGDIEVSQS